MTAEYTWSQSKHAMSMMSRYYGRAYAKGSSDWHAREKVGGVCGDLTPPADTRARGQPAGAFKGGGPSSVHDCPCTPGGERTRARAQVSSSTQSLRSPCVHVCVCVCACRCTMPLQWREWRSPIRECLSHAVSCTSKLLVMLAGCVAPDSCITGGTDIGGLSPIAQLLSCTLQPLIYSHAGLR